MSALQSESNISPDKQYTIPKEYFGKKLKDEDLVKLGERSSTADYIKHNISYVLAMVKQDKNALNNYNNYFKDKAKSIIKIHNENYIATVTGKKVDDVSVKFIHSQIPQERVLSDDVGNKDKKLLILNTLKIMDLENEVKETPTHWIHKFIKSDDLKNIESTHSKENFELWSKLNALNEMISDFKISPEEFQALMEFTTLKSEIKTVSVGQVYQMYDLVKLYSSIPKDQKDRLGVVQKLSLLNSATQHYSKVTTTEQSPSIEGNKTFLLEHPIGRSLVDFIPSDKAINESEYKDIAEIMTLCKKNKIDTLSVLVGCKTISDIKNAVQKLVDQDKYLEKLASQLGLSADDLKKDPESSKELAAIISLYNSYSGSDKSIIEFSEKHKSTGLKNFVDNLKNDPQTKQYQAIQKVMTNYVQLGVNPTDLEELKKDLLNIPLDNKFEEKFTKIKEDFNLKQYREILSKWNLDFGPFGSVLSSQLSKDVEQGTVHYLEQHKTTKTLNDLALYANAWKTDGLQDEFYAFIMTTWGEGAFKTNYESIMKEDPSLLPEFIEKFGETLFKALTPIKKEEIKEIKEKLTKMELEDVYLNKLLPQLFKVSDVSMSTKIERMKEIAGIYQSAEGAYGKQVADWILQEVDIGATDWKPNDLLNPMRKLQKEFITLSSEELIDGNFRSLVGESANSSKSMAETMKTMQRVINEKFLSVPLLKGDMSTPIQNAFSTMIKENYPGLLSGESSYQDSNFANKSLADKITLVAPYLPSLQKAGFDQAFISAYLKNDDNPKVLNTRLGEMTIMAAWINKGEKSPREKELCKAILLEFRSSMVLKDNNFVNSASFTTLVNTCLNHDPKGIYSSSVLARGLAKGLENDRINIKESAPEKILATYIANNQTFLTKGDRFDNNYNAKFAQIYFTIFAEDSAKAVSTNFSEKHRAFLKDLLLQTKEFPANEAVKNHMKDIISFAIPLFEEGIYKDEDIIVEITRATKRSMETLNKQETIPPFNKGVKLDVINNLDKSINMPSSVLLKTLKTDPFFFVGTFASKLISGFLKDKDKESIKGFDESLSRLKDPFNQNPFVIKGVSQLIPILDNPILPLSALMEEGDVQGIFRMLNGALKGAKMIKMDEKGKLVAPTEEAVIQTALFTVLQKASNVIAKTTSLDKQEKIPDEVKTLMTLMTTLVKWKGWITSLTKTWLPHIATLVSKIGGGTLTGKVAELALPIIINKVVANMDIDETTKISLKELISKAPVPVINGILMALPGIIEKIQVDKYLDFLEFMTQQYAKEQPDDPVKVQEKLLAITQTLAEDVTKFMPILEETLEATVEIKK